MLTGERTFRIFVRHHRVWIGMLCIWVSRAQNDLKRQSVAIDRDRRGLIKPHTNLREVGHRKVGEQPTVHIRFASKRAVHRYSPAGCVPFDARMSARRGFATPAASSCRDAPTKHDER